MKSEAMSSGDNTMVSGDTLVRTAVIWTANIKTHQQLSSTL